MSSVLHVSSGAISPVVAASRFYSSAAAVSSSASRSSALALAPSPPRLAGFRKLKSSSSYTVAIRIRSAWNASKPSSVKSFAAPSPSPSSSPSLSSLSSPSLSPSLFSSGAPARGRGFSMPRGWLSKLGLGGANQRAAQTDAYNSAAQGADDDKPAAGQQFATFGAGCFWGVELAFQRVPGVSKTEVGYSQGLLHEPTYGDVCDGDTMHSEVVRVEFDPAQCQYEKLLEVFWGQHDPTTLNRQGGDRGTQYRSGIYFHTPEQEKAAKESAEKEQKKLNNKIVTEILAAKKFYRAEEYHQQYLAKGGRHGFRQSTAKGCKDPIRCYG